MQGQNWKGIKMTDKEHYLQNLLSEIERAKSKGKRYICRINAEISPDVARYVENYFNNDPSYRIDIKFCRNCKNIYDIKVHFVT